MNKPHRYWKDIKNVNAVLEEIIKKTREFPTQRELYTQGYAGMLSGIQDYHGGLNKMRSNYGHKEKQHPEGYWTKRKTLALCRQLIKEEGYLPTQREIRKLNGQYSGLQSGIDTNGGLNKIRDSLKLPKPRRGSTYWTRTSIEKEIKKIIRKEKTIPAERQLRATGYGSLVSAMRRYGGLAAYREKYNIENKKEVNCYWNRERVLEEARKMYTKHGYLPSINSIKKEDSTLAQRITMYFGTAKLRMILNEEAGQMSENDQLEDLLDDYTN